MVVNQALPVLTIVVPILIFLYFRKGVAHEAQSLECHPSLPNLLILAKCDCGKIQFRVEKFKVSKFFIPVFCWHSVVPFGEQKQKYSLPSGG